MNLARVSLVPVGGKGEGAVTLPLFPPLLPHSAQGSGGEGWGSLPFPIPQAPPSCSQLHPLTPTPLQPSRSLHSFCCKTRHFPHSHPVMRTKPQNISFLTLSQAGLFPPHPTPPPASAPHQLFSPSWHPPPLESPNSWGSPKRAMTKAPRKWNVLPPGRSAADLVIIKRPATLGNSFSLWIPVGN